MAKEKKETPPSRREQLAAQRLADRVREAERLAAEYESRLDPRQRVAG